MEKMPALKHNLAKKRIRRINAALYFTGNDSDMVMANGKSQVTMTGLSMCPIAKRSRSIPLKRRVYLQTNGIRPRSGCSVGMRITEEAHVRQSIWPSNLTRCSFLIPSILRSAGSTAMYEMSPPLDIFILRPQFHAGWSPSAILVSYPGHTAASISRAGSAHTNS